LIYSRPASSKSRRPAIDTLPLEFSAHAKTRSAQRSITEIDAAYVWRHGKRVHRTGCTFFVLRRRDIPLTDLRNDAFAKLEGAVLLVENGKVITTYINKGAYRDILKKSKQGWRKAA